MTKRMKLLNLSYPTKITRAYADIAALLNVYQKRVIWLFTTYTEISLIFRMQKSLENQRLQKTLSTAMRPTS